MRVRWHFIDASARLMFKIKVCRALDAPFFPTAIGFWLTGRTNGKHASENKNAERTQTWHLQLFNKFHHNASVRWAAFFCRLAPANTPAPATHSGQSTFRKFIRACVRSHTTHSVRKHPRTLHTHWTQIITHNRKQTERNEKRRQPEINISLGRWC